MAAQGQRPLITDAQPRGASRLYFIDNLRWSMIILVVSMHAADTYSPLGSWYYTDRVPLSTANLIAFAAWQMYLQSFFMGLLFFVAAYFVPASLDRKGPRQFIRDRAFRLGLPVLFYMFVLGPVVEYFLAHSWTSTRPTSFANEWIKHIRNGQFLQENGPLWFCLALLVFSVVYAALRDRSGSAAHERMRRNAPGTAGLILFAAAMAAATFVVRLVLPSGASFLNMHLGDFPHYILLFTAGLVAARQQWLPKLSLRSGVLWMAVILPVGFAGWLATLSIGGALQGHGQAYSGGWYWQSAAMNVWESFTCAALCYGLLVLFREKFNSQPPAAKFLSDNAFAVYVFHPVFVIVAARAMHGIEWPPLVKFAVLTVSALLLTYAASALLFRRIPVLRRIL
jgi:glucan biosynthesis protein C